MPGERTWRDSLSRLRRLGRVRARRSRHQLRRLRVRAYGARARLRWTAPFALGIVAALVAVAAYGAAQTKPHLLDQADVNRSIASALASQTPAPPFSQQVFRALEPSLVLVQAQLPSPSPAASPSGPGSSGLPAASSSPSLAASPVPSRPPAAPDRALGSGVVVDDAGDILTALHVVAGASSVSVTFADGTSSAAAVASTQPDHDVAVLRAERPPAQIVPAVLGDPRSVRVGNEAYVLGNPFGLEASESAGIISGLDRSFEMPNGGPTLTGLIQIDAAVNPGNSGGPLVNRDGEVVGIVTALINPTKQDVFIGIGLAVPIDIATSGGPAQLPQY